MHTKRAGAQSKTEALPGGLALGVAVLACLFFCAPAGAAQISTGATEACMVLSGGHIECWGRNESGELGNATNISADSPVEVENVADARDVSVGEQDVCAVLSSGHVDCWGSNTDGALGDGEQGYFSQTPVEVKGIASAVQVAVGRNHACAVLSGGTVDCWGAKVIEAIDSPSSTPVQVPGIADATQAAVGGSHSCALLSSGHVECWEENFNGELGDGTTRGASENPVEVHGVTSADQIAAGNEHTCALLSSGRIDCWGGNEEGQLGDGTTALSEVAAEVTGIDNAIQLAAGGNDSCALTSEGRVECWGDNYYGQFDDGSIRSSDTPVEAHALTGVAQLSVAGSFSCALFSSGSAACWGDGESDQLGDGVDGGERDAPIAVHGLIGVTQAAVGWPHACAVVSVGQLDCWGENAFGELGDGTTERQEAPVAVHGLSQVVQVSAGEHDSCAVLVTGRVDCWGGDNFEVGQLGNGTDGSSTTPVEVKGITTATHVATSTYGSCALLSAGHVDCWGAGGGGSLGNGTRDEPSDVPVEVDDITDAVQIAAGEEHFCAVLASGRVDCWGGNGDGQLGDGTDRISDIPVEVQGLTDATEVAAGYQHTCALLSSGQVDCWGENANGQLGDGTTIGPKLCEETWVACSEVPVEVPDLTGATEIAAGGNDSCALVSGGRVACWGGDDSGQIGDDTFGPNGCEDDLCNREEPTEVAGLTGATSIAVGGNQDFDSLGTACAVVSGGQLECWGANSGGVLGDDLAWSTTPVPIVGSGTIEPSGGSGGTGEPGGTGGTVQPPGSSGGTVESPGGSSGTAKPLGGVAEGPRLSPASAGAGVGALGAKAGSSDPSVLSFVATTTRGDRVALRLTCHATSQCRGVVSVTIERAEAHHSTRRLSLGTWRFASQAGGVDRLILRLNAYAHALLARGEALQCTVTVALSGSSPARYTGALIVDPAKGATPG